MERAAKMIKEEATNVQIVKIQFDFTKTKDSHSVEEYQTQIID